MTHKRDRKWWASEALILAGLILAAVLTW